MVVPVALRPAAPRAAAQPFRFLASIVPALHGPGLSQRDKRYQSGNADCRAVRLLQLCGQFFVA